MDLRKEMKDLCACLCRQDELYAVLARREGLSYHTVMTLYALDHDQGCTQKQIAENWMIPKQTVNTVVKELERSGYVELRAGRDQKEKLVFFTPAGKAFAAEGLRELYETEERAVKAMGEARFREMVAANRAFTEAFSAEVSHGA